MALYKIKEEQLLNKWNETYKNDILTEEEFEENYLYRDEENYEDGFNVEIINYNSNESTCSINIYFKHNNKSILLDTLNYDDVYKEYKKELEKYDEEEIAETIADIDSWECLENNYIKAEEEFGNIYIVFNSIREYEEMTLEELNEETDSNFETIEELSNNEKYQVGSLHEYKEIFVTNNNNHIIYYKQ